LGTGIGVSRTGGRLGPPFETSGSAISAHILDLVLPNLSALIPRTGCATLDRLGR